MKRLLPLFALATGLVLASGLSAQTPPPEPPPASAPAPAAVPAPPALPAAPEVVQTFFEGIRISFDGKAQVAGVVGIDTKVSGGEIKRVWVRVLPKSDEGAVAKDVAKELTFALGSSFKVKTSGGRITIAKANKKAPSVYAAVAGLNLYGMSVRIEPD
jgi:hypothetical protein